MTRRPSEDESVLDAERSVIGSLILEPVRIPGIAGLLEVRDMHDERNRTLLGALLEMAERGTPIELATVEGHLLAAKALERAGGLDYLIACAHAVTSSAHVLHHAGVVARAALLRRVVAAANEDIRCVSDTSPHDEDAVCRLLESCTARRHELAASGSSGRGAGGRRLVDTPVSEIDEREIGWLWRDRIPLGKTTLLYGDPNLGKSLLTMGLVAAVSRGGLLPDRTLAPKGSALILSAEDDPADTIRPRLRAAGADLERCHILTVARGWFTLVEDLPALKETIDKIGDVRLVVIDPLTAYLGGTDSHRNADVRELLGPLGELAGKTGAAFVLVSHINKGASLNALHRAMGSLAFVAAARAAWIIVQDPKDKLRRLFLPTKSNLGPAVAGLAYKVVIGEHGGPTLAWEPDPVEVDLSEILAGSGGRTRGGGVLEEAKEFLREELAEGPRTVKELEDAAKGAGISWATVLRAKKALRVRSGKHGFGSEGVWTWALPKGAQAPSTPENVSTLGEDEHLRTGDPAKDGSGAPEGAHGAEDAHVSTVNTFAANGCADTAEQHGECFPPTTSAPSFDVEESAA